MPNEQTKKEAAEQGGEDKWMLSYGDMMTLLLTFFVLLFAMSSLDAPAMREMVISLRGTFGVLTGGERVFLPGDLPQPEPASGEPLASHALMQALPKDLSTSEEEGESAEEQGETVQIIERSGETIVRFPGVNFAAGSFELTEEGKQQLSRIQDLISFYQNEVTVAGHTDETLVRQDALLRSNWHLSALRAAEVVRYFVDQGMSESKFSIAAYGSTRPLPSGDTDRNRRIDIIFRPLASKGSQE